MVGWRRVRVYNFCEISHCQQKVFFFSLSVFNRSHTTHTIYNMMYINLL